MFCKDDIIQIVKELNLTEKQYCLIAGASLVLHQINEFTEDIDIVVTAEEFSRISKLQKLLPSDKKEYNKLYYIENRPIEIRIVDKTAETANAGMQKKGIEGLAAEMDLPFDVIDG